MNVHISDTVEARNVRSAAIRLMTAQRDFTRLVRSPYFTEKQFEVAQDEAERREAALMAALSDIGIGKATVEVLREVLV